MDKKKTTIIGKDVIESLTMAMYEDSKFIYREYIQNAADQIDKAVNEGLLKNPKEGYISIRIDKRTKTISIEDNATGISYGQVEDVLKNIAQSTKQRGIDKGFTGIGRLGGCVDRELNPVHISRQNNVLYIQVTINIHISCI